MALAEDIAAKQTEIDTQVATDNQLHTDIAEDRQQLSDLKAQYAVQEIPAALAGTAFTLQMAANTNMPTLRGTNAAIGTLINDIKGTPVVRSVVVGGVTVAANGNTITLSITGATDALTAALALGDFIQDNTIVPDVAAAIVTRDGNITRATQFNTTASNQTDIIEAITGGTAPVLTATVATASPMAGSPVQVTFSATGTPTPTFNIVWGDTTTADDTTGATSPATHTYSIDGTYTATVTAVNTVGTDTKTLTIVVGDGNG